jgi:hypothetical protein
MNLLQELEKWVGGHKARQCNISIDNGYGATSWAVSLWHENGTLRACESVGEVMIYKIDKMETLSELDNHYADEYINISIHNKDWAGLETTLKIALREVGVEL